MTEVKVQIFSENPEIALPSYAKVGDSGMDVCFNGKVVGQDIPESTPEFTLGIGSTAIFKTGLYVAIPEGYEIQVRSRSGLAAKNSVCVLNSPGTVDSQYRGEIGIILHNANNGPDGRAMVIKKRDRIAQLVLTPVFKAIWDVVEKKEDLSVTDRGEGGFGHTGIASK